MIVYDCLQCSYGFLKLSWCLSWFSCNSLMLSIVRFPFDLLLFSLVFLTVFHIVPHVFGSYPVVVLCISIVSLCFLMLVYEFPAFLVVFLSMPAVLYDFLTFRLCLQLFPHDVRLGFPCFPKCSLLLVVKFLIFCVVFLYEFLLVPFVF
jgi:hypothetical protein